MTLFATNIRIFFYYLHYCLMYCVLFTHIFFACQPKNNKEDTNPEQQNKQISAENDAGKKNMGKNNILSENNNVQLVTDKSENTKNEKNTDSKNNENKKAKISKVQDLLAKFSKEKDTKIQFAPLDNQIISSDTLFKSKNNIYELNFATSCANDSLVAQEMSDIQQRKTIILAHNYQTDIAFKVNGLHTTKKTIKKDLFQNKIEGNFLEKSIIKHPQFVRFDETKNEAIFEFIIGVPNTDWLVIAAVNLSPQGNFRIIDIMMPEM